MSAVLVFVLGLLVGVLAGIAMRDAVELWRASRKDKPMPNSSPAAAVLAYRTLIALLSVAFVANAVTAVLLLTTRASATKYAECTAHWQQSWARAYEARYEPAVRASRALDRVIRSVADHDADEFHAAIAHYQHVRDEQNKARASHPLPPLPASVCGPPNGAGR